jgi:ABC-type nitrate/sulfonate/bicarbonate transport system substrate-binding protein
MKELRIGLDWTPNINHIGILIAKEKGWYAGSGINLIIIDPSGDDYKVTPAKKLELGAADLAIGPFESVVSLNNKANAVQVKAIYAILQKDISSISVLKSSGIESPAQLDGKVYASYKARYEDEIVKRMIRNSGGHGAINISYPSKLGIWNTLLTGEADATWIFDNWEGVEAACSGVELRCFRMADYGIPYGYSPVIFTRQDLIETQTEILKSFVHHTKAGYLYAQSNPEESANILSRFIPEADMNKIDLLQCLSRFGHCFGNNETAGWMKPENVAAFLSWLADNQLESESICSMDLYTNYFVPRPVTVT